MRSEKLSDKSADDTDLNQALIVSNSSSSSHTISEKLATFKYTPEQTGKDYLVHSHLAGSKSPFDDSVYPRSAESLKAGLVTPESLVDTLHRKNVQSTEVNSDKMDIQAILDNMNSRFDKIDEKLNLVDSHETKIQAIEVKAEATRQKVVLVSDQVKECCNDHAKVNLLVDLVIRQDEQIQMLKERVTDLQSRSMKANVIISGIKEKEDEDCKELAKDFFKTKVKTEGEIEIEAAHRLGVGQNRQMVVRLADVEDKAKIFENSKNLKDLTNEDNKKFFVNDQVPEEMSEMRKQAKWLTQDNYETKSNAHKLQLKIKRGQLQLDGQPYVKEVDAPTPNQMLKASAKQMKRVDQIRIFESKTVSERGSTFKAHTAEVTTPQEVRDAYIKVRKLNGTATHVACSYTLAGAIGTHNQGMIDDGEHGSGRLMLNYMKTHKIANQVFFIVRKYGGTKIGPYRFNIMERVVKDVHEIMVNTSFEQLDRDSENEVQLKQNEENQTVMTNGQP